MRELGVVTAGLLLGVGCNLKEFTVNQTAPVIQDASRSFAAESDIKLARDAAPAQLKTADGFLVASPNNKTLLEVVARGYIEYAFGFLEDDFESLPDDDKHAKERDELTRRATDLYDRALGFALRYVQQEDKHFPETFAKDVASSEAAVMRQEKDSMPGLLFAGIALASAINLNRDNLARVVDLPKAIALVKRAHDLDPKFYNAGAAMTLGIIYSAQGKAVGGDPEAARRYFDEAVAVTGGRYLMARVMKARHYAHAVQDRALFESTLKEVLNTPPTVMPEQRLANELARRRAARYLAHVEDYF